MLCQPGIVTEREQVKGRGSVFDAPSDSAPFLIASTLDCGTLTPSTLTLCFLEGGAGAEGDVGPEFEPLPAACAIAVAACTVGLDPAALAPFT